MARAPPGTRARRPGARRRPHQGRQAPPHHRRRRHHLRRSQRGAARPGHRHRHPGGRHPGRQGRHQLRPPQRRGRCGLHRLRLRQPHRRQGRPHHRRGHPLLRLHHGLQDPVQEPRREVREHQRHPLRRRQGERRDGGGRRPRGPGGPDRGARGLPCRGGLLRGDHRGEGGLAQGHRALLPPGPRAPARPDRGLRRPQRAHGGGGRGHQRRRLHARRPPGPVAGPQPAAVPRGVRLLLHGLRGARRHGRQARPPRGRGGRHRGRRHLPDAPHGAGHRGPGEHQGHLRPAAELRLLLHRRPVGVPRLPALRHQVPPPRRGQPPGRRAGHRRRRHRRQRPILGPGRPRGPHHRGVQGGLPPGRGLRPPHDDPHRDRPLRPQPARLELVGRAGLRGLRAGVHAARLRGVPA